MLKESAVSDYFKGIYTIVKKLSDSTRTNTKLSDKDIGMLALLLSKLTGKIRSEYEKLVTEKSASATETINDIVMQLRNIHKIIKK